MPSNYTQNYQLNQWAAGDPVLHADFNADNAKIDAALKANADAISSETSARISAVQAEASARASAVSSEASARASAVQAARDACPLVTLRTVTLSSSVSQYDLSLTGFDWNTYGEVIIYALLKCQSSLGTVKVLLNGQTGSSYYYKSESGTTEEMNSIQFNSAGVTAVCRVFRSEKGFYTQWQDKTSWPVTKYVYSRLENTDRTAFTTMNFAGALAAGTKFTILGVRG